MRVYTKFIGILMLSALFFTSCGKEKFEAESENRFLMGTVCIITLFSGESQDIFDGAFDIIAEEDRLMSLQKENSDLGRINSTAGISSAAVSPDTYNVIESALSFARISDGAFDPTIAPLVELWGIGEDFIGTVPESGAIDEARGFTDYKAVRLEPDFTVSLERAGMKIDLGGIAKGYIADKVKEFLLEKGVERGIINLGGNIVVLGSKPGQEPWKIGIQDPFNSRGNHIGIASVSSKTVVTSGIYERYFISDGKRYHHILDPETGYPVENDLASVTIISDLSIDADALSTSLFVLGVEEGMALIETIEGSEAIFVTRDRRVIASSGVGNQFKLHHDDFSMTGLQEYLSTSRQ